MTRKRLWIIIINNESLLRRALGGPAEGRKTMPALDIISHSVLISSLTPC